MSEIYKAEPDMWEQLEMENALNNYENELQWLAAEIGSTGPKSKEKSFWWISLQKDWKYEVPWISDSAKKNKHKQFPEVAFWNCRLTKGLWTVVFSDSLVISNNWKQRKEAHKETFYSQKKLPWWWLDIPWRHVAKDGTVRDKDWYIVIASPLVEKGKYDPYPKGTKVMTTLWPWKVYDKWWMTWKWFDIYVNW
jgi:hypothetical protein